MKFGVLGPLRVRTDAGVELVLRSRHQRTVLAALLLQAGAVVPVDRLVAALWPERPPASYASNLQTYVSRLRDRGVVIEHRGDGYLLRADADEVDALVFQHEVAVGRAALAAGDPGTAVDRFRRALRLWRGRPLADLAVPLLEPDVTRWELEWLGVREDCAEAELSVGGDLAAVLADLTTLVAEHPLRERAHGLLMVALCRAGRRAEALAAYQHARDTLVAELGVEPGRPLRELHRAILRGEEPALAAPVPAAGPAAPAAAPSPFPVCQLPPAPPGFVGRAASLDQLETLLDPSGGAVPVVAISGQPGVGKSALAVVAAHRIRARFPDGQLFVHLAGASAAPRDPAAVLADVLRALGVPGSAVPQNLSALAAAYRARLADRRVLVVLDDAASPAQIRPLLPGTPGSAVLITSRRRLSGLIDATHLAVAPLTDAETQALLAHVVGTERVAEEPREAARIAAACGNLPLAVRIAGTRVATRSWPLATLADRLDDERRRLDELAAGDQQVRASLALSVQALAPATRDAFGLLGSLGPVSFAGWAVAELLDRPDAERIVDELVEASLLEVTRPAGGGEPRYRLHDLLRVYAEELAATRAPAGVMARRRLVGAAAALAATAATRLPRTLTWARLADLTVEVSPRPATVERVAADPAGWLGAELDFLIALLGLAADCGADRAAIDLAERLGPFLWVHGHWAKLRTVQRLARQAAERVGDERTIARTDFIDGVLSFARGDLAGAAEQLARGRARFERIGDRHGLACLLSDQAALHDYQNRVGEAAETARQAMTLFRAEGDSLGAILAAPVLSSALRALGRLDEALEVDQATRAEARELGVAEIVLARCLNALALTRLLRGEAVLAYGAAERAVQLLRAVGDRYVLLAALRHLASAAICLNRRAEAIRLLRESHELAVRLGDRPWATGLARDLAVSWIGDGRAAAAVRVLRDCVRTFEEMQMPSAQAATLRMLARAHDELGDEAAARDARFWADMLTDPRDTRTPAMADIVLRLADAPGLLTGTG